MRVGQWPKRLLLYRTERPFPKLKAGAIEILGLGQQFVAFGVHPVTGKPYYWPDGETPLDVHCDDLPVIDEEMAKAFLAEAAPHASFAPRLGSCGRRRVSAEANGIVRENGKVVDGRDAWLSQIAYHTVHDALDAGRDLDTDTLAALAWARFAESADLNRKRMDGAQPYAPSHARQKVIDKVRLVREGRLPPRDNECPRPQYAPPELSAEEGRERLRALLDDFCCNVISWHRHRGTDIPLLGIRATVGLGKSHAARRALPELIEKLRAQCLPHRVLVFTPSHALAEETAAAFSKSGVGAAVLRGYDRKHPSGEPMCKDIEMVRAALDCRLPVQDTVCMAKDGARCGFFETCLKQRNRRDVATADVVVAPYDALFSGISLEEDNVAMLLVDEGCWQRAVEIDRGLAVEDLRTGHLSGTGVSNDGPGSVGAMADLVALRARLGETLIRVAKGASLVAALITASLSHDDCVRAAKLEASRKRAPGLTPSMDEEQRPRALKTAKANLHIERFVRL